jgi:phage tail sheath protein FI
MPVPVSYPGVYINEVPGGARAIAGVPTSVAALVGYTTRGRVSDPEQIFSFADFERKFGGLHADSPLSYAASHFFLNGGASAWIVRVAENAERASVVLQTAGGTDTLRVSASSEGRWGNDLQLIVDYDTSSPGSTFNLTVNEVRELNGRRVAVRSETHRNLSMNPDSANFVEDAVRASSDLIEVESLGVSGDNGAATSGPLTDTNASGLTNITRRLAVSVNGGEPLEFDLFGDGEIAPASLAALATDIQDGVRALLGNDDFNVVVTNGRLEATSITGGLNSSVVFRRAGVNSATAALRLGLANGGREADGSAVARPASSGTSGGRLPDFAGTEVTATETLTVELEDFAGNPIDDSTVVTFDTAPATLAEARTMLENGLRSSTIPAVARATVVVIDDALVVRAAGDIPSHTLVFSGDVADDLDLVSADAVVNLATYQPGIGPTGAFQGAVTGGADGEPPTDLSLVSGSRNDKTGMYALEDVDLFNILNLPEIIDVGVLTEAVVYAEERRSMILIDIDKNLNTLDEARGWINDPANSGLKHRNAVAYFPRVRLADPLQNGRLRTFANSGLMAGLYARTDAERGVWKAPAGIDARLRGVQALDYILSDPENGVLNPLALNCLRTFPVFGTVSWGARTLVGADAFASEWKYVPVRRLALFIEESLYRGTQFVVFEPNDEPLWAQIRLSVGSFMQNLFRQGAFQGQTPQEAYLVRCDNSTTTQADIDLGIVNIMVGFAPLKPAEFVIINIQQLAGQGQS